jgi:hypothetical protein
LKPARSPLIAAMAEDMPWVTVGIWEALVVQTVCMDLTAGIWEALVVQAVGTAPASAGNSERTRKAKQSMMSLSLFLPRERDRFLQNSHFFPTDK